MRHSLDPCRALRRCKSTEKSRTSSLLALGRIFVFTNAIIGVQPAVEGFGVLDSAGIERSLFVPLQERTTLCGEKAALALRIAGVDGQVPEDVFSSLTSPANYVFVDGLEGSPVNDAAITGASAGVFRGQLFNRIEMRRRITKGTAKAEAAVPQPRWPAESRQGPVLAQCTSRCGLGTGLASHGNDNVGIPELSSPCPDFFCPDFSC
jgi:hypothetical protein